jgi:hypothetical protein
MYYLLMLSWARARDEAGIKGEKAMGDKQDAYRFLRGLEGYLDKYLPDWQVITEELPKIRRAAKGDERQKHKRGAEHAFINHYAIPRIFEYVSRQPGMGEDKTRQALLSESYRNLKEYCSASPARSQRHPFKKALGGKAADVMRQWTSTVGASLVQSCPDFALRAPFPHKIVFEGKYFANGSLTRGRTELATDIYQAFFYLGLPYVPETKTHPAWDYDYACLFAFDATPEGHFLNAWRSLDSKVRKGFWEGANIYVMILRGTS